MRRSSPPATSLGACAMAGALAERADGREDVGQAAVPVVEDGNRRPLELPLEVGLRAVDGDEIGSQRHHPFDVGIEERADPGQRRHLGRIGVEAAHRHDLRTGADGEEHLGERRDQRDDAARRRRRSRRRLRRAARHRRSAEGTEQRRRGEPGERQASGRHQLFLTSSQRKNGPPIIAVTMPTGSSSGASAVRAIRSQPIRNAAPNSADAGSTRR